MKTTLRKKIRMNMRSALLVVMAAVCVLLSANPAAAAAGEVYAGFSKNIYAVGSYANWDGVSNVAQFVNEKGQYCCAYDDDKQVVVIKTKKGKPVGTKIRLKKKHPLFGTVTCDTDGNYYLVTGETNDTDDRSKNTIFISKYDKNGKHIKTVGDNGSSSLASWYDTSFYTKIPFDGGNCDAAVNGSLLTVNYAREMYSGHQSNSVLTINTKTMKKADSGQMYNSHSFAQRVVPYQDGFVYASEGDCYPRAFTVNCVSMKTDGTLSKNDEADIFHFWVKKGALDEYNMYVVNNNYAHMGGLAVADDGAVCLVGSSVKSLSRKADKESEQIFIQIFDPSKNPGSAAAYATSGKRSGLSGENGTTKVTDYGVKWLTKANKNVRISNPQVVADGKGTIVVLFEQRKDYKYQGVYYIVLDKNGKVISKKQKYSAQAQLNHCEMPVFAGGTVYWTANRANDTSGKAYVYALRVNQ